MSCVTRQIVDPNAELNSATALFLSGMNTKYIGLEYKLRKTQNPRGNMDHQTTL